MTGMLKNLPDDRPVPLSAAARVVGLSLKTMHRRRLDGKLQCLRVGSNRWHTTKAALAAMIGDGANTMPTETPGRRKRRRQREIQQAEKELAAAGW
jgi:hypothetical protein